MVNPVLVALDLEDLADALSLASSLRPHVGGFKVGLELLMSEGPRAVSEVAALGLPVFADAKLHDIPTTVEHAAFQLARRGARWITAHASGGRAMLAAAVAGLSRGAPTEAGVLAVTVLTSLDEADLAAVGMSGSAGALSTELAVLAESTGAEGVICSPHEVAAIKTATRGLIAVTPGIRLMETQAVDQKRAATPREALAAGADYLVIGRAITVAPDPVAAAEAIVRSIGGPGPR